MVIPLTNYKKGRGEQKPLIVVIHRISLPGLTAESALQRFTNPNEEVSSHAICKYDGTIINIVNDEDTAYCNGKVVNPRSSLVKMFFQKGVSINEISLSLENEGSEYNDLTEAQYKSNAKWVREKCVKFNIPIDALHVIPHNFVRSDKSCPGKISMERIIALASAAQPIYPDIPTPSLNPVEAQISLLQAILQAYQKLLALLLDKQALGAQRSGSWPKVRKAYLKENPECAVCGKLGTLLNPNQVHHIFPVHAFPEMELLETNFITLCKTHHLEFGHLGSFHSWNETVEDDTNYWKLRIENRP